MSYTLSPFSGDALDIFDKVAPSSLSIPIRAINTVQTRPYETFTHTLQVKELRLSIFVKNWASCREYDGGK